jgi:hypothetical protein
MTSVFYRKPRYREKIKSTPENPSRTGSAKLYTTKSINISPQHVCWRNRGKRIHVERAAVKARGNALGGLAWNYDEALKGRDGRRLSIAPFQGFTRRFSRIPRALPGL